MDDRLPATASLRLLRGVQDQELEREGVGMVLSLEDAPPAAGEHRGTAYVEALDEIRAELFPSQRDTDLGVLISTVQAFSAKVWRA